MSVAIRWKVSRAVRALNARHRPCMSGTPVGNNLSGIWSQLGFLMPALLDGRCAFPNGSAPRSRRTAMLRPEPCWRGGRSRSYWWSSSISTSAAAEMPGVFAVYTAQELDDLVKPVRASSRMENYHATTLYPLAREKVR